MDGRPADESSSCNAEFIPFLFDNVRQIRRDAQEKREKEKRMLDTQEA